MYHDSHIIPLTPLMSSFTGKRVDVEAQACRNDGNASVERSDGVMGSGIYNNMNNRLV